RRVLLGGEGVHLTAHGFHGLGDVLRGALFGPLEQQVLEEVGDAGQARLLVARADVDPEPDRHRVRVRHAFGDDADPILEPGLAAAAPPEPSPGGSPTRERATLPCGSMSSTRTLTSSPRLRTSSTRSTRLPWPSLEMWSNPSRPGRMLTNAPNLVMFTTLP